MLNIKIKILDVVTEVETDQNLSFDAIDSILNRAVQSTLQSYLSLPLEDRLAPYKVGNLIDEYDDDDDDDEDER
jgi:hypothetical protein